MLTTYLTRVPFCYKFFDFFLFQIPGGMFNAYIVPLCKKASLVMTKCSSNAVGDNCFRSK